MPVSSPCLSILRTLAVSMLQYRLLFRTFPVLVTYTPIGIKKHTPCHTIYTSLSLRLLKGAISDGGISWPFVTAKPTYAFRIRTVVSPSIGIGTKKSWMLTLHGL